MTVHRSAAFSVARWAGMLALLTSARACHRTESSTMSPGRVVVDATPPSVYFNSPTGGFCTRIPVEGFAGEPRAPAPYGDCSSRVPPPPDTTGPAAGVFIESTTASVRRTEPRACCYGIQYPPPPPPVPNAPPGR